MKPGRLLQGCSLAVICAWLPRPSSAIRCYTASYDVKNWNRCVKNWNRCARCRSRSFVRRCQRMLSSRRLSRACAGGVCKDIKLNAREWRPLPDAQTTCMESSSGTTSACSPAPCPCARVCAFLKAATPKLASFPASSIGEGPSAIPHLERASCCQTSRRLTCRTSMHSRAGSCVHTDTMACQGTWPTSTCVWHARTLATKRCARRGREPGQADTCFFDAP
jgi:hypothetical protein